MAPKKVCVVGAGVSVMTTAACGQWLYDARTDAGDPLGLAGVHSHSYRVPDSFRNEVVVMVGCKQSGKDIALDLSKVAREERISVKFVDDVAAGVPKMVSRHRNIHLHGQIDCLCEDGTVVFADGTRLVADTVIYCTGYDYSYPFLDTGGMVTVDDNCVRPLFEHTFPPALVPSLSFVGVPRKVVVPLFYEVQARWIAQVLSGRRTLPPVDEMLRYVEEYNRAREMAGVPKRHTHTSSTWRLGKQFRRNFTEISDISPFPYCDEFGEKHCGFPRLPEWKKELMWSSLHNMRDDHEMSRDNYRDSELVRLGLRSQGWLP
ncbi:hypothetical protein EJB05_13708, partial [Eragrostis curvula]